MEFGNETVQQKPLSFAIAAVSLSKQMIRGRGIQAVESFSM
jgi:hypothetical protein